MNIIDDDGASAARALGLPKLRSPEERKAAGRNFLVAIEEVEDPSNEGLLLTRIYDYSEQFFDSQILFEVLSKESEIKLFQARCQGVRDFIKSLLEDEIPNGKIITDLVKRNVLSEEHGQRFISNARNFLIMEGRRIPAAHMALHITDEKEKSDILEYAAAEIIMDYHGEKEAFPIFFPLVKGMNDNARLFTITTWLFDARKSHWDGELPKASGDTHERVQLLLDNEEMNPNEAIKWLRNERYFRVSKELMERLIFNGAELECLKKHLDSDYMFEADRDKLKKAAEDAVKLRSKVVANLRFSYSTTIHDVTRIIQDVSSMIVDYTSFSRKEIRARCYSQVTSGG